MRKRELVKKLAAVLWCLWVSCQFIACEKNVPTLEEKDLAHRIESTWKTLRKKNLISGAILIQRGDNVLFSDGDTNKEFAISSMSKSFVGWKYFSLQKQGLDLNTPVCHWLKNFCKATLKSITLQMLLDHRAGFGRDLSLTHFMARTFNPDWSIENIDRLSLSEKDLKNPPQTKFLYSNFGYLVLSRILELIEQKKFALIVEDIRLQAHLQSTSVIEKYEILPVLILLPFANLQGNLNLETILFRSAGTGGIKASAQDIGKWLGYLNKTQSQQVFDNVNFRYRNGLVRSEGKPYEAYWHNGASLGAYSLMAFIPKSDLRIVILSDNLKWTKQWSQEVEQFEQFFY